MEKRRVHLGQVGRESSHRNEGVRVVKPHAEHLSAAGNDFHDVAGGGRSPDLLDLIAENPGMTCQQPQFFVTPEGDLVGKMDDVYHHLQGIKLQRQPQGKRVDIPCVSDYISSMYRAGENIAQPPAADLACVIFDIDGTLTRTNQLIFASFNHVAEKYLGTRLAPEDIVSLFGPPEEGGLAKLLGGERVPEAMDDLCRFYLAHHAAMAGVHAGIPEVLHFLKGRGIRLAVCTGKGNRTTAITLSALGLAETFDMIVSGSDVVHHKPHPEGIARVLENFAVPVERVLMVGDAVSDIRASRSAGVRVAAVLWDSMDRERVLGAGADMVFHTVAEMHAWFRLSLQ
jgi:HAD superfamily hydrolase (TIGR01509 family)